MKNCRSPIHPRCYNKVSLSRFVEAAFPCYHFYMERKDPMKKLLALILVLACLLSGNALALDYTMRLENEATFETMEEVQVNGPAFFNQLTGRDNYGPDPAMDGYPLGTTWVYRSPNMYTNASAAPRMSTTILVYTDAAFPSKDDALAYLKNMGLTDIVDAAHGSVVLVTPINPEAGFGDADQYAFYQLQSAMTNIGGSSGGSPSVTYADNIYYGGLTYRYVIGIDGGATFLNNYVSSQLDFVGRIAGLLLVNGSMEYIRKVASQVPVYLVNPTEHALEQYKAANGVNAWGYDGDVEVFYDQDVPLRKVCVEYTDSVDLSKLVPEVYEGMFKTLMRNAVIRNAIYTPTGPFRGYNFNDAPYSISERVPFYTGRTPGNVILKEMHDSEKFADLASEASPSAYLDVWYELIPEEALDGSVADHSMPLILFNHGGGDDVMQYLDEIGALLIAEHERVAIVAPYHSGVNDLPGTLTALVRYMLETYPALDSSRVYVCGYSMGGRASVAALCGDASLFAAAVPQGAVFFPDTANYGDQYKDIDLPILCCTSTYDFHIDPDARALHWSNYYGIDAIYFDYMTTINLFLGYNEMPTVEFDFDKYPYAGFKADTYRRTMLDKEYPCHEWYINKDGVPMVGLSVFENLPHGLYQEYARIAWDFMKHYARNQETGEIVYTAIVD